MDAISTHNTPTALYDALVSRFGETIARKETSETRWVSIGCGRTVLTFFAGAGDVHVSTDEETTYEHRP